MAANRGAGAGYSDRNLIIETQAGQTPMNAESGYLVDVIGFNQTERLLLSSIFGLAARRAPSSQQREPSSPAPADLYLVDADNDAAMQELRAVQARFPAPTVLVGNSDRGTGLPLTARPI